MALDFWDVLLLGAGLVLVAVIYRLIWWMATGTETVLSFLTQAGLHQMARLLLAILIGYDAQTYHKSRFILWNRASVRFAILWGGFVIIGCLLGLLHLGRFIESMPLAWFLLLGSYLGLRCLIYWIKPRRPTISTVEPSLQSLIRDVNEQMPFTKQTGRSIIRRYDYLDELFSEPV